MVLDARLTQASAAELSRQVEDCLLSHQWAKEAAGRAAWFTEEMGLSILERNRKMKKPLLIELSLFLKEDSVLMIERDSGELFDLTDSDLAVKGLSSFVLSGLMTAQQEKNYLVTTGYNRNMIRFEKGK